MDRDVVSVTLAKERREHVRSSCFSIRDAAMSSRDCERERKREKKSVFFIPHCLDWDDQTGVVVRINTIPDSCLGRMLGTFSLLLCVICVNVYRISYRTGCR